MTPLDPLTNILTAENVFRLLIIIILIGYLFFSLFLYLRLRILAITLESQYAGLLRYAGFLNLIGTLVVFVVLGLLIWLV